MELYFFFFAAVFTGSVIQGAFSFGYAMFMMAVLPYLIPVKTAVILSALSSFFISGTVCWKFRKQIDFRTILIPLFTAVACILPGAYLLNITNDRILRKALGMTIVLFSMVFLFAARHQFRMKPTLVNQLLFGVTSGVLAGMFGVGGPPLVFYLLTVIQDNITYKATLELAFITLSAGILLSQGLLGNVTPHLIIYIGLGCLAAIGGTLLGLNFFKRLNRDRLKRWIYFMMMILGALLIFKN